MEELKRGSTFTQVPWKMHRLNALLQDLYKGDYEPDESDNRFIKHYRFNDRKAMGVSCFVPLETPHNVPGPRCSRGNCYFLPERECLSEGLALFYTHKMKLRFPAGEQTGLHFFIAPTIPMTKEIYERAVKDLGWQLCTNKTNAEMTELISLDDDLKGIEDFRMNELYWLMEIWYTQTTYSMDRLHANDIHTWIALDKPSFQDLIQHESRAHIVFSALTRLSAITPVSHVTELTYLGDILGELEDAFGWKTELCAQVGEDIQQAEDDEQVVRMWDKERVVMFLKSAMNLNEKYIEKFKEQEINGLSFLLLREELLIQKPGPFEFPFGIAVAILELANTIRKRENFKKYGKGMDKYIIETMAKDIIEKTMENIRRKNMDWSVKEKLTLLETVVEHLPNTLPWSEIAEKFEGRTYSDCCNQWLRRKEKGLIAWLTQNED